ncbi:MAG: hypothetical protein HY720_20670 [Planctomycetes bacterium]|nr:hypothetical protein [Planctomycetota bacterium]
MRSEKERWSLTAVSVARVTGDFLLVNTRLLVRVRQGQLRRFRLRLPEGVEIAAFETENLKSRRVVSGEIEIEFASPVATQHPLLLATRVRRRGLAIPPLLALTASEADGQAAPVEAYVALLAPSRPFAVEERVEGLARVELRDLPFAPAGLSRDAVQSAYRATSPSWRLALSERGIEVVPGDAVVEIADLHTAIGEDGTIRTRAEYTVRHSGVQFLALDLPAGASLWGVTVGGWPVSVGTTREAGTGEAGTGEAGTGGGARLAIPIEDLDRSNLPVVVTLYYEERGPAPSFLETTRSLSSPRLVGERVKVTKTVWTVEVPEGYWVDEDLEEMRLIPASRKYQERVEDLLDEKTRVENILNTTTNERARDRARRDMARLEQILGDELAELEQSNRSAGERELAGKIGQGELDSQWALNDTLIEKGQAEQKRLRDLRGQVPDQGAASREEAAFLESLRFLEGRDWETPGAPAEGRPGAGGDKNEELPGRPRPFQGWAGRGWPALPALEERSASLAHERTRAPDSGPSGPGPLDLPGIEAFEPHPGRTTYTFQSLGSEANLEIALTRQQTSVEIGSWGVILLALAAAGWVGHRRRRTGW